MCVSVFGFRYGSQGIGISLKSERTALGDGFRAVKASSRGRGRPTRSPSSALLPFLFWGRASPY